MSFGAELKDFTAAFSTGYNIGADRRDKKWQRERAALNDPIDREYKQAATESMKKRNAWYDTIAQDQHDTARKGLEWYDRDHQRAVDATDASIFRAINPFRTGKPAETLDSEPPEGQPDASGSPVGDHAPAAVDTSPQADTSSDGDADSDTSADDTDSDAGDDASVQNMSYRPASSSTDVYSRFMKTVYNQGVKNPNGLAAIAATATRESKFNPRNAYGAWSDPSESGQAGTAGGIMSWRGNRYLGLQQFAAKLGDDPRRPSPETQAKYLFHEDPSLKDKLNAAKSPGQAQQIMNNAWAFAGYDRNSPERNARMSLANQYAQQYGQFLSNGGMVQAIPVQRVVHAAVGGTIPDVSDDEEDQTALPVQQPQQVAQALPVNAPVPTERPMDQPTPTGADTSGGNATPRDVGYNPAVAGDPRVVGFTKAHEAVLDGIRYSLQQMGIAQGAAVTDPNRAKAMADYLKGAGAAPKAIIDQAYDVVDPKKQLPESERTMAALGMVYDHYTKRGQPDKAKAAAASIVQYQRKLFQQYSAIAKAAIADGDIDAATKAAVKAYASVPDGQDIKVKKLDDGRYQLNITDEATGQTVQKPVLTPQEIGGWAMKVNPGTFDQFIMEAAGQRKQGGGPPSDDFQKLASGIDAGKLPSNTDMAALPLSEQKELRQRVAAYQKTQGAGGVKPPTYSENNAVRKAMTETYDSMAAETDPDSEKPVIPGMDKLSVHDKGVIVDTASDVVGNPKNRGGGVNISERDAIEGAITVSKMSPDNYKVEDVDHGKLVTLPDERAIWMPKARFNQLSNIYKRDLAAMKKAQADKEATTAGNANKNKAMNERITQAQKDRPGLLGNQAIPAPTMGVTPQTTLDDLQKLMGQ